MEDTKTEQDDKPKRKTHTGSAVKQRYNQKTYTQYVISLRKIDDAEIIALIESEKEKGYGISDAIKNLIKKNKKLL